MHVCCCQFVTFLKAFMHGLTAAVAQIATTMTNLFSMFCFRQFKTFRIVFCAGKKDLKFWRLKPRKHSVAPSVTSLKKLGQFLQFQYNMWKKDCFCYQSILVASCYSSACMTGLLFCHGSLFLSTKVRNPPLSGF